MFGHVFDWVEYDSRIEKEDYYADTSVGYCTRCHAFRQLRMDDGHH